MRPKTRDDSGAWAAINPPPTNSAPGSTIDSVTNGPLAMLDPTLSLNGPYELRLTATDVAGHSVVTEPISLIFDGNMKVGNFAISFNDLTVPAAGIPIQVTRSYDSRDKSVGDFGVGWRLDIASIRLYKNRPLGLDWEESSTGSPYDLSQAYHLDPVHPRIVSIVFPGGKVQKFQLIPSPMDQGLFPIGYPQWRFVPMGNTTGSLVPADYDDEDGSFMAVEGAIPGTVNLYDLNYLSEWLLNPDYASLTEEDLNRYPTLFRYTTPEGFKYLIDEVEVLKSLTDPNGNTLLVSTNGITWTNAVTGTNLAVAFQRDDQNRITNIIDTAGPTSPIITTSLETSTA